MSVQPGVGHHSGHRGKRRAGGKARQIVHRGLLKGGRVLELGHRGLKTSPLPTPPSAPGSCWQMTRSSGCRQ